MAARLHPRLTLLRRLTVTLTKPHHYHRPLSTVPLHSPFPPQILIPRRRSSASVPHLKLKATPGLAGLAHSNSGGAFSTATSDVSSDYLSVTIRCRKEDAEALSEALLSFGASSAYMDDLTDLEDLDEISITSIFPQDARVGTCISEAASSINLEYNPGYDISVGKQCDWVANVQESFEPTKVADGLWIVPSWREPLDLQATNIILDPGLAFGTGEHPTTKLCLLLLQKIVKGGEHVLDYGTGSGILGIASLKCRWEQLYL